MKIDPAKETACLASCPVLSTKNCCLFCAHEQWCKRVCYNHNEATREARIKTCDAVEMKEVIDNG